MTEKTKKLLHSYGFFTCILLIMFTILILVVFFSRNSGHKTMKCMLQNKLDSYYENQYQVLDAENINLPLSVSSFVFSVKNVDKKIDSTSKIIAIKMTGIYGPFVGVFFYLEDNVQFLGTLGLPENDHEYTWNSISKKQFDYWANNIKNVFKGDE